MKLTGKCKEDFEKWALLNAEYIFDYAIENDDKTGIPTYEGRYFHYQDIDDLPKSMQYGVYVDFFDSVGIKISVNFTHENFRFDGWWFTILTNNDEIDKPFDTRQEARTKAIEKANDIYNERN